MKAVKWITLILVAGYGAWTLFQWNWYLKIVPAEIGTTYPVYIGSQSDFREGCGVAIFRLDRATTLKIQAEGLRFLASARHSRGSEDHYHTFEEWQPTPHPGDVEDDQSILTHGLVCSGAWSYLSTPLEDAVRVPGSFYVFGPEKVIVVIPSERVAVLAWNG